MRRMALTLLQRLHQAKLRVNAGGAAGGRWCGRCGRPVFFRAAPSMVTAIGLWSEDALLRCIEQARRVETGLQTDGQPP